MEIETLIRKMVKEEGLQLFSSLPEGFLLPNILDVSFQPSTSFLGRSITKAEGGSIRDLVFLTLFLTALAEEVDIFGEKKWRTFRFSKVGKAKLLDEKNLSSLMEKTMVETPLGYIKPDSAIIGKKGKLLVLGKERKELPYFKPFSFLKDNFIIAYAKNRVEGNLYYSSRKDDLNVPLASVAFIINGDELWTWEQKILSLSSSPLVALAQGKKLLNNVIFGGIANGVYLPWPEVLLNIEWAKFIAENTKPPEQFSLWHRIAMMEKAKRLGVYMLNAGGDVKYFIEEKKRREDLFSTEIIAGEDFIEFLKKEKLKEGIDYVIAGEEIIMKLATLLTIGLKRIFSKTFTVRLSYNEKSVRVRDELGVALRTANFYRERAKPGDIVLQGRFVDEKRIEVKYATVFEGGKEYVKNVFSNVKSDLFVGDVSYFKVERFADRIIFFPEEEEV